MNRRLFLGMLCLPLIAGWTLAETGDVPDLQGDVLTVAVGDYKVDFRQSAEWTLGNVLYKGKPLLNYTGANQTVINVKLPVQAGPDAWIGSSHGGETVHSVVLKVDGQPFAVNESFAAPAGQEYQLVKESDIGPYRVTTETTVTADGVREVVSFTEREAADQVRYLYVFMHCWNSALKEWGATLTDGSEVVDTFPLERTNLLKQDITSLALYSPENGIGAVMRYPEPYEGEPGHSNFLACWPDRHNKHYLRMRPDQVTDKKFVCEIRGFSALPEDWKDEARQVSKSLGESSR